MYLLRRAEFGPFVFDCADDILKVCPHPARLHHELTDLFVQKAFAVTGARFREFGNHRTHARAHFEKAFLDEVLNNLVRGVGVNFQIRRERADRGKRLARKEFTADERFGGGEDNLIEDGLAGSKSDLQTCHINNVTEGTGEVKRKIRQS